MLRHLVLCVLLAACHHATPAPVPPSTDQVIARTLPSVVLVVRYDPAGAIGFGSGVVIEGGRILTNVHVVDGGRALGVLTYDAKRPTYTVLDGGLKRFLFEQQSAIRPVREINRDSSLDLAILAFDDGKPAPDPLRIERRTAKIGERVLAIGHPSEALWSFTSGEVSALPEGMIQHDALISPGSSGGPLLDGNGDVLGINTAMVKASHGAGFARPTSLVRAFIDNERSVGLDLSTPRVATQSCLRALERGSHTPSGCEELMTSGFSDGPLARSPVASEIKQVVNPADYEFSVFLSMAGGLSTVGSLDAPKLPALAPCTSSNELCASPGDPLDRARANLIARLRALWPKLDPGHRARLLTTAKDALATVAPKLAAHRALIKATCGLSSWREVDVQTALHRGWRVVDVVERPKAKTPHAWILVEGQGPNDKRFQFSEMRVEHGGFVDTLISDAHGWKLHVPSDAELLDLPTGWPPTLLTTDVLQQDIFVQLATTILDASHP